MKINISSIKIRPDRSPLFECTVTQLKDSITTLGLLNPITVDSDYNLISGAHRLEACKRLGLTEIEANVTTLEGLMAELAEIDENLVRNNDAHYLRRGEHLARRKEIYEALFPQTKNGGDRRSEEIRTKQFRSDNEKTFTEDTAEKLGVSRRSVEQSVQLAENLSPEAKDKIIEFNVPMRKALEVARKEPEEQVSTVLDFAEERARWYQERRKQIQSDGDAALAITKAVNRVYRLDTSDEAIAAAYRGRGAPYLTAQDALRHIRDAIDVLEEIYTKYSNYARRQKEDEQKQVH